MYLEVGESLLCTHGEELGGFISGSPDEIACRNQYLK
jgi:hypothetical protein